VHVKQVLKRRAFRAIRWALHRYVAQRPRAAEGDAGPPAVTILLGSAWGMGGTIRATLNFAGYLAQRHPVEVISLVRKREEPFFPLPERVLFTTLDDRRPGATPPLLRPLRSLLTRRSSVLVNRHDRVYREASLWTDLVLARRLRGRSGFLIGTRPGLNLLAADLSPPGCIAIGQEQMHLRSHDVALRRAFRRSYPRLAAMVVLTERDRERYERLLEGQVPVFVIPNTIRSDVGGVAPLEGTTVLAAGRLTRQKGFDKLVKAFAQVAPSHPEWRLRICGAGPWRRRLERLIARQGLQHVATLPGPAEPLAAEMDTAALFVLSSRFEGFPLVLIEAMAKGLPVVAFDCPTGPGEIIEDHRNGLLVPRGSVDRLADGMRELIGDPELRRRLGSAAAHSARDYTIEAVGPRWEQLLEHLWTGGRHARAARASSSSRSRVLRVIDAARSNSARASSARPSLASRSPRTLGRR
jgi:glycosyltransferase involved in cell wall biosynthesis